MEREYGFIYLLQSNEFPSLYKIGHSHISPKDRANELTYSAYTCSMTGFHLVDFCKTALAKEFIEGFYSDFSLCRLLSAPDFLLLKTDDVLEILDCFAELKAEHALMTKVK